MLKNHLIIAWRNLFRNRSFSIINILGLAVGMAGTILIYTWIQRQYSYDDFHANKDVLFEAWQTASDQAGNTWSFEETPGPLAATLKDEYPEVQDAARIYWPVQRLFNYQGKLIKADGRDVDKPFLTMFSFPLIEGDVKHALDGVNDIVITRTLAGKLFGHESALNKMVSIDSKQNYRITGVMDDLPSNSVFQFDYLVSLAANEKYYTAGNTWNNFSYHTYVQLKPGVNVAQFDQKLQDLYARHTKDSKAEVFLHPLSKWHLYNKFNKTQPTGGLIEVVHLVTLIAVLILLVACINFMNLSTARSEKRAREVGVRKVMGAGRWSLVWQFLSESVLIAFLAGLLSLVIVQLCLPAFNSFTHEHLSIRYTDPVFVIGFIAFILITGVLAGSYPAFFLSAFRPVKVLKGSLGSGGRSLLTPRKALVVVQFSVAIVMVVATVVIYRQIMHAQQRDSGYSMNGLIDVAIEGNINKNFNAIRSELVSTGAATSVAKLAFSVTQQVSTSSNYRWPNGQGKPPEVSFTRFNTTGDFVRTVGVGLLSGRDIDLERHPTDTNAVMLNEAAVKRMQLKDPVGATIYYNDKPLTVVGVFKDVIIGSPYSPVEPMVIHGYRDWNYNMVIRLNPQLSVKESLQRTEEVFKKYNPQYPFEYKFVDERYAEKFADEVRTGTLAALFSGLTIFISCLGLFGLAAYMAESRAKEISIRRVLGASIGNVIRLLTSEFVMLVVIALAIATPIGWWLMDNWLQGYTYRIDLSWVTFVLAGCIALILAVLTVSAQAFKAARANPARNMRSDQ